jgi:hypothetical protein
MLTRLTRGLVALGLTLGIAACATAPAADIQPPPMKQLDAKTQLESGRRYEAYSIGAKSGFALLAPMLTFRLAHR